MTKKEILNLKFDCYDLDRKVTVREYFKELLLELWRGVECFSGKRPLGSSDWQVELYTVLINNKIIKGTLCENGYASDFNRAEADEVIEKLIKSL